MNVDQLESIFWTFEFIPHAEKEIFDFGSSLMEY